MTGIDALLHQPAAQAVGWALLHFIWQGTLVGVLTALVLLALRRSTADVRYVVSAIGLAVMLTLPVVTGVQTWNASQPIADRGHRRSQIIASSAVSEATPRRETDVAARASHLAPGIVAAKPRTSGVGSPTSTLGARFEPLLPVLIGIWLAGVLLLSLRLLTGWLWIQRLRTHGAKAAAEQWQRMAARLSRRLHIARTITLLESTLVDVPTVIGWVKPVVLLPASALSGLSAPQLEAILAHEFAHIRRHDYLVNLLQTLVETLLFYHPAVWWLSRRIRAEREHCCDDLAVSLCGDPIAYANALADLESLRSSRLHFAMAATGGSLLYRVRRLIGTPPSHAGRGPAWLAGSVALILLGGIAVGADGLRQTAAPPSRPSPSGSAVASTAPFNAAEVTAALEAANAAIHHALEALGLQPLVGALPLPNEGVITQRFGHAFEQALRAQEEALHAHNDAMLSDRADHARAAAALRDQEQALIEQAAALADTAACSPQRPRARTLCLQARQQLRQAETAVAALSESTAPALAEANAAIQAAKAQRSSSTEEHVNISHHQDNSSGNWVWSNNGEKLSVSYSGRFDFTDDDTDVREISSGGYLKISDAAWIGRHTVEIRERGGQLEHRYFVNGSERSYEPEGREWLRDNLPKFVRNTGIGAERRVARYLRSGGPSAVLAEISRIDSSYVKRLYFTELLNQATLNADQYRAILRQAGREVNSDYELATLLIGIADKIPADEPSRAAYFTAASSISSDYELRRVYAKMLDKGPVSPAILDSILSNTGSIESDYELAELLRQILGQQSLDDKTRPLFFKAVASISSDYERHRVLSAALRGTPDNATITGALNRAGDIGSDYEAAQFLLEVLQKANVEGAAREPFFTVVNRLNSTYERRRVLEALIRKPGISRETLQAILQSAREMSGYDLAQVLLAVAGMHTLTGDLRDSYLDAADRLSGYEQGQVMTALVKSERRK